MRLYRPVGQAELDLIAKVDYREYPPRLPEQPIFYPVLNEKYAREIAEKWNKNLPIRVMQDMLQHLKLKIPIFLNLIFKQ